MSEYSPAVAVVFIFCSSTRASDDESSVVFKKEGLLVAVTLALAPLVLVIVTLVVLVLVMLIDGAILVLLVTDAVGVPITSAAAGELEALMPTVRAAD